MTTRAAECDMRIRWPWQTREDDVIRLLDAAIESAAKNRTEAQRLTSSVRREAERKMKEDFDDA